MGVHVSPPSLISLSSPSPPHPSRLLQSPGLSSQSHTANSHWLSILHMVMYVSVLLSPYSPYIPCSPFSSTPAVSISLLSMSVSPHCCPSSNFIGTIFLCFVYVAAAAAATLLQLCPTLCDPKDGSPPGSAFPGILPARTLEWVAISFSIA